MMTVISRDKIMKDLLKNKSNVTKPLQCHYRSVMDKNHYKLLTIKNIIKTFFFFVTSIKALAFKYFYTIEISNNPQNFQKF